MPATLLSADLRIRDATVDDLPAIVAMLADDELGQQRERNESPLPDCYHRAFAELDADPHNRLMIAETDATVIATLHLTLIPSLSFQGERRAQIQAVRVAREWRGRGIGEWLFRETIHEARRAGCRLVQLTTNSVRADARRFYERLGFEASHVGMKIDLHKHNPGTSTGGA